MFNNKLLYFKHLPIVSVFFTLSFQAQHQQPSVMKVYTGAGTAPLTYIVNNQIVELEGSLLSLKNVDTVMVSYDYSNMEVASSKTEKDYLFQKSKSLGQKKMQKFLLKWDAAPANLYEPAFESTLSGAPKTYQRIISDSYHEPEVKLIVTVQKLDPEGVTQGFKVVPYINLICSFVHKEKGVLLSFKLSAYGTRERGFDQKLKECFAIAGKMMRKKLIYPFVIVK